jgi:hypothetical protein
LVVLVGRHGPLSRPNAAEVNPLCWVQDNIAHDLVLSDCMIISSCNEPDQIHRALVHLKDAHDLSVGVRRPTIGNRILADGFLMNRQVDEV